MKKRNFILDLLRVIACVGVVSIHMKQAYAVKDSSPLLNIIYKFCDAGANGVALLFVLSGYFAWIDFSESARHILLLLSFT